MRKKLNRMESQALQKAKIAQALAGTGRFSFMNRTRGEIFLPKAGLDGKKRLQPKEQFIGDSYFFSMVPNELLIVENLDAVQAQKDAAQIQKENAMAEKAKVLLTEQPPVYTQNGQVEYVQEDPSKRLVEQPKPEGKLLIEPANDSVVVIR